MPNYKKLFANKNIMQKTVLENVQREDKRVDKPLFSKIVNYACLPTPEQLYIICKTLNCAAIDIYTKKELNLISIDGGDSQTLGVNKATLATRQRRLNKKGEIYNLTVEINLQMAEVVKAHLKNYGYTDMTDFIRQVVHKFYEQILKEQKNRNVNETQSG